MKVKISLVAGALAVSLALPAAANAGERPTPTDVRERVRVADKALDQVKSLVRQESDAAASKALARYRRAMNAATSDAEGVRGKSAMAEVERVLGYRFDRCAVVLSRVVDDAAGGTQVDIAKAITDCLGSREEAIADLTALLEVVPEPAKSAIARAIAVLSQSGGQVVDALTGAFETGAIPPQVGELLKHALETAVAAVDKAFDRLNALTSLVPEMVRPIVQQALTMVTDQLHQVIGMVTGMLGQLTNGQDGGNYLPALPFKLPIQLPFAIPGFGFATR